MSIENTRKVVEGFLGSGHQTDYLTDDTVFITMFDGQKQRGPQAIGGMMQYLYQVAFDARFEPRTRIFGDDHAAVEGEFVGKHIGEFVGVPPTGKEVRVPLCIIYAVKGDKINQARVYFEVPALMAQLGEQTPG